MSNNNSNNDPSSVNPKDVNAIVFQAMLLFYKAQIDGKDFDSFSFGPTQPFQGFQIDHFKFDYETDVNLILRTRERIDNQSYIVQFNQFFIDIYKMLGSQADEYLSYVKDKRFIDNTTIYRFLIHPIFLEDPRCKITFLPSVGGWEYKEKIILPEEKKKESPEKKLNLTYLSYTFKQIDGFNLIQVNNILKDLELASVFGLDAGKNILKQYIPAEITGKEIIDNFSEERIDFMNKQNLIKVASVLKLVDEKDELKLRRTIKGVIAYFRLANKVKFPMTVDEADQMKREDYGMLIDSEIKKMKTINDRNVIEKILQKFDKIYNPTLDLLGLKNLVITVIVEARARNYHKYDLKVEGTYIPDKKETLYNAIKFNMTKHWPLIENNASWMKIFNRLKLHPESNEKPQMPEEKYEKCLESIGVLFSYLDKMEPVPLEIYNKCLEDTEGI